MFPTIQRPNLRQNLRLSLALFHPQVIADGRGEESHWEGLVVFGGEDFVYISVRKLKRLHWVKKLE
jgi:hypothetical protein